MSAVSVVWLRLRVPGDLPGCIGTSSPTLDGYCYGVLYSLGVWLYLWRYWAGNAVLKDFFIFLKDLACIGRYKGYSFNVG